MVYEPISMLALIRTEIGVSLYVSISIGIWWMPAVKIRYYSTALHWTFWCSLPPKIQHGNATGRL